MRLYAAAGDLDLAEVGLLVDDGLERRSRYVLVVEGDVDGVVASLGWQVRHRARTISIITTIDSCFAGSLNRHPKATLTGTSRIDDELGWFIH